MAQAGWIYLDDAGRQHRVGLYHGDRSGHLAIFCNKKVVQVDLSVKETAMYSFFIEDELCEIHLIKGLNGLFSYEFKTNREVDTPLNRQRKAVRLLDNRRIAAMIAGILVFVAGMFVFNHYQKKWRMESTLTGRGITANLTPEQTAQLQKDGKTAIATFFIVETDGQKAAHYTFSTANGIQVSGKVSSESGPDVILPNRFRLMDRDEFEIWYLPQTPTVHRINFGNPQLITVRRYLEQAIEAEQLLHPERTPAHNRCVAETIYQVKSWKELATIVQLAQHQGDEQQNQTAYNQLLNGEEVKQAVAGRCGGE